MQEDRRARSGISWLLLAQFENFFSALLGDHAEISEAD